MGKFPNIGQLWKMKFCLLFRVTIFPSASIKFSFNFLFRQAYLLFLIFFHHSKPVRLNLLGRRADQKLLTAAAHLFSYYVTDMHRFQCNDLCGKCIKKWIGHSRELSTAISFKEVNKSN